MIHSLLLYLTPELDRPSSSALSPSDAEMCALVVPGIIGEEFEFDGHETRDEGRG